MNICASIPLFIEEESDIIIIIVNILWFIHKMSPFVLPSLFFIFLYRGREKKRNDNSLVLKKVTLCDS